MAPEVGGPPESEAVTPAPEGAELGLEAEAEAIREPAAEPVARVRAWQSLPRRPAARAVPTGADLTGTWVEVDAPRPRGPVQRTETCAGVSGYWSFEQRGDAVQAELRGTTNYSSGVRGRFVVPDHTFVAGTRQGPSIALEGYFHEGYMNYGPPGAQTLVQTTVPEDQAFTMTLRFDRRSGHLVGTKNGEPVRLAPLRVVPLTAPCPPVRPRA